MKHIRHFCSTCALCMLISTCYGQTDSTRGGHLELAPYLTFGTSIYSGAVPDGIETLPSVAYAGGVMAMIVFNEDPDFAIISGASYESRAVQFRWKDMAEPRQTLRINYLCIPSGLKWKKLFLLAVVGVPLSAYQRITPDGYIYTTEQSPDPIEFRSGPVDVSMTDAMLVDVRLGGLIPIIEKEHIHMDVFVQASYALSNFLSDGIEILPLSGAPQPRAKGNGIITLQAGLSYFFSLN